MVIFTGVPMRPRMRSIVSLRFSASTGTSSTARMRSPASTPALYAGVSSIGLMTLTAPFSSATSMPTPEYSPVVLMRISSNCSGSRIRGVRIQVGDQAADRCFDQLLVGDALDVFAAHVLQHLGEQTRVLPRHRRIRGAAGNALCCRLRLDLALGFDGAADGQAEAGDHAQRQDERKADGCAQAGQLACHCWKFVCLGFWALGAGARKA